MIYEDWNEYISKYEPYMELFIEFLQRPWKENVYGLGMDVVLEKLFQGTSEIDRIQDGFKSRKMLTAPAYLYRHYLCILSKNNKNRNWRFSRVLNVSGPEFLMFDIDLYNEDGVQFESPFSIKELTTSVEEIINGDVLITPSPRGQHIIFKCDTREQFKKIRNLASKYTHICGGRIYTAQIPIWWPGKEESK